MPDPSTPPDDALRRARWSSEVRARLSTLRLSATREMEIVEELSQHLDDRWRELIAGGASPDAATQLALADFKDGEALARHIAALRQARASTSIAPGSPGRHALGDVWQDLRYAARMFRKHPGFAAAAVLTLALGIGANTAIFSLVNATLLQRLPASDRDELVYAYRGAVGGAFSYPLYQALRDNNQTLEGLAAWAAMTVSLGADGTTDVVNGAIVTGNLFDLLGIRAGQGRLLAPADDVTPGAHPVAVISHELWQTRFGGRDDIVGRDIRLNGHVFTIVGVTPPAFPGPQVGRVRHLYAPMMMQAILRPAGTAEDPDLLADRRRRTDGTKGPTPSWLFALGRLKAGITPESARAELAALATHYERTFDPSDSSELVAVVPLDEGDPRQRQQLRSVALLLGGVVAAVLMIACANIANLLLAKTTSRRRELALRLALGASRARLLRQLLTESILLSCIGGVIGVALAWAVAVLFKATPPPPGALPIALDFSVDRRVLMFSVTLSFVTGILFGIIPALKASRPNLIPALKDASANIDERGHRFSTQKALVIAEVALSMLLLIPAGLFVRSLHAARSIDPGVDVEKLVASPLNINLLRYSTVTGREFYRRIVDHVQRLPGVEAASVARVPMLTGTGRVTGLMVEGRQGYSDEFVQGSGPGIVTVNRNHINTNVVGPGFFKTVGIPFVAGRDFTESDTQGRTPVVIVNETAAKMHFGGSSPIGQRINLGGQKGPWLEIVGVVRDSKYATLREVALAVAYIPVTQLHQPAMTLYVRTSVPPASIIANLRRELQTMEPNLPVAEIRTMTDTVGAALYTARMGAWLLSLFGSLALILAAVGIYGVLSFSIARRTREMGIRLALGARAMNLFLLIVRDGMMLVGVGIVIGVTSGFIGARSLASFLYGVSTSDVPTFAMMAIVLSAVALAACVIPARRAMRVNPITALRYE